jgi:putative nucleotidyltransferase with HDIG domain
MKQFWWRIHQQGFLSRVVGDHRRSGEAGASLPGFRLPHEPSLPLLPEPSTQVQPLPPITRAKSVQVVPRNRRLGRLQPAIALSLSVLALTTALGQRYYRQPELQVGTVVPEDIVAPSDVIVVDHETTETKRTAARNGTVPVLIPDKEVNVRVENSLNSLFQQAEILRRKAGRFPYIETLQVSSASQQYLRAASPLEWANLWSVVTALTTRIEANKLATAQWANTLANLPVYQELSPSQQTVVRELVRHQQWQASTDLEPLQRVIEAARSDYQLAIADLNRLSQAERGLPNLPILLRLSDSEWRAVQGRVQLVVQRMLLQGIADGVPREMLAIAAQSQLNNTLPKETEPLAKALITTVLEPNLTQDPIKTREKAEAAAEQVPDVTISVQAGEVIVRTGNAIDRNAFVLLDYFELSQRRLNLWGLLGFGVMTTGAIAGFVLVERANFSQLRLRDHGLLLFLVLGVSGFSVVGLAVYSLPAVGLLASTFYGATLGSTVVGLVAILLPFGTQVNTIPLLASTAGALVCSTLAPRLRSREELALLGGVVGVIQGAVYLALTLFLHPVALTTWYLPLTGAMIQGIYGLVSSVAALGLSPYLEHLFDLVTPIRLAELSSPNRPMLQRLASEAPGTFQHTVFVATLAEAAARSLRCNVELVRAGTLYHDIGKMHDPLWFIENQMGGPNKHDAIDDPWVSADIIKKHVSIGIEMARRCRLPKAVRDFIPEHQGTMQISYFFHQAQKKAAQDPTISVNEADFRYPGPIPQSPETGIVMLADSCEAALRSLKEASPEEALAMVNRIMKARWQDGQLKDCGLTRDHLHAIAQIFVQVWQQYNHKRIAYPKSTLNTIATRS